MSISPFSALPFVSSVLPQATTAAKATTATTPGTSSSNPSTSGTDSIGSTFLSLLVQELQNQDPTAPMDSTAMVGQMISLNQLNQLTNINQVLSTAYGGAGTTSGGSSGKTSISGSGSPNGTNAEALTATQTALRLLNGGTVSARPQVSTSVTLPSTPTIF